MYLYRLLYLLISVIFINFKLFSCFINNDENIFFAREILIEEKAFYLKRLTVCLGVKIKIAALFRRHLFRQKNRTQKQYKLLSLIRDL